MTIPKTNGGDSQGFRCRDHPAFIRFIFAIRGQTKTIKFWQGKWATHRIREISFRRVDLALLIVSRNILRIEQPRKTLNVASIRWTRGDALQGRPKIGRAS